MIRTVTAFFTATALMALQNAGPAVAAERFLDGFPDIPLLPGVSEIMPENRLVFDTPSGTLAETALSATEGSARLIDRYAEALGGLGWVCRRTQARLTCLRSGQRITFESAAAKNTPSQMVRIRLEPRAVSGSDGG